MTKRHILTLFLLLLSTVAVVGANAYIRTGRFMHMDRIVDSCVLDDGSAYDMWDDGGNYVYLRHISPDGVLLSKQFLIKSEENIFMKRQIIGVENGDVYLYEWNYNVMNYGGTLERVLRCRPENGTADELYRVENAEYSFAAREIRDGAVYLICQAADGLVLRKIDIDGGNSEDIMSVEPPREITEFYLDENMDLVVISPDSSVRASSDGCVWRNYDAVPEEQREYTIKSVPFPLLWDDTIRSMLAAELAGAWLLCAMILHFAYKDRTALLSKQIMIFSPALAVGLILLFVMFRSALNKTVASQVHDRLMTSAAKMTMTIDAEKFDAINWDDPFEDEYYCMLREELQEASLGETHDWKYGEAPAYSYTCYWLYYIEDGEALIGACDNMTIGMPAEEDEAFGLAIGSGMPEYYDKFDILGEGEWLNVLYPIKLGDEVIGLVETSEPLIQSTYAFSDFSLSAELLVVTIIVTEMLVFLAILSLTIKNVNKLKLGALAISNGDYKYRVSIKTNDELSDIARAFNQMSETVERSISDISGTSKAYSCFVPSEMFAILGKQDVLSVRLGDSASVNSVLLTLRIHNFEEYNRREDLFEFLNSFFNCAAPFIAENGGFVERYSETGLSAMFGGASGALRAAESIITETAGAAGCTAVIEYGSVLLGVIGGGGRMSVKIVSRQMSKLDSICRLGEKIGCSLIVAGAAYDGAVENSRLLGYISENGELTALYDIFGCDETKLGKGKTETLEAFQHAVELYYQNDFYKARSGFIDVIKHSPLDLAAREYLLMSDKLYLSGATEFKPLLEL